MGAQAVAIPSLRPNPAVQLTASREIVGMLKVVSSALVEHSWKRYGHTA